MIRKRIPFGMMFEEKGVSHYNSFPEPIYDPNESLSYVQDMTGAHIPFINAGVVCVGTRTATAVRTEESDTDEDRSVAMLGTETATKVHTEGNDDD